MPREEKSPVQSSKERDEKVDRERAETTALRDSLAASSEKIQNLQLDLSLANKRYVRCCLSLLIFDHTAYTVKPRHGDFVFVPHPLQCTASMHTLLAGQ